MGSMQPVCKCLNHNKIVPSILTPNNLGGNTRAKSLRLSHNSLARDQIIRHALRPSSSSWDAHKITAQHDRGFYTCKQLQLRVKPHSCWRHRGSYGLKCKASQKCYIVQSTHVPFINKQRSNTLHWKSHSHGKIMCSGARCQSKAH